jgi:hypothetical protein
MLRPDKLTNEKQCKRAGGVQIDSNQFNSLVLVNKRMFGDRGITFKGLTYFQAIVL